MGRVRADTEDGRVVILGYDRPFQTFFAQLFDAGGDPDDPPVKAVGYHPVERVPHEPTEHGVYPADMGDLDRAFVQWGLTEADRDRCGAALTRDPDARAVLG